MAPKAMLKRPAGAREALKRPAAAREALRSPAAAREALKRPTAARDRSRSRERTAPPKLQALLLGLERRPDRRQRCEDMLKKEVPWLSVEFFRATDGKVDTIPDAEVAKTWNTSSNSLYGSYEDVQDKDGKVIYTAEQFVDPGVDYEFSPGERGCAHSHYRMWERAAAADAPILILEDDMQIVFERSQGGKMTGAAFTERLNLGLAEAAKKDVDVLYLGWSGFRDGNYKHLKAARGKKNQILRKAEYVWTTVAYIIWPKGAKKLLDRAQPMNQPVDNFMGWECREGRLNSYVLLDEGDEDETWAGGIVTQLDFTGDSDIKKSDGGDQGDDPTAFLAKKETDVAAPAPMDVEDTPAAVTEEGAEQSVPDVGA